ESVVDVGNDFYYLSDEGVIKLAYDANYSAYTLVNISKSKIKALTNTFKRSGSTGVYAEDTQTIHWLVTTGSSAYLHNTELIYDTVLDSFYKFKYNTEILYKP